MAEKAEFERMSSDISTEFSSMDTFSFNAFLRSKSKEPSLSITWECSGDNNADRITMRRLKAFLETSHNQQRSVTVRASEEQHESHPNEFSSGINWEKI